VREKVGRRKTEDGRQKTEDRRRKTEDGRRKTEDGRQKTEVLLVIIIGIILSISSFFWNLSNKWSKKQNESIKNNQHIDSKTKSISL